MSLMRTSRRLTKAAFWLGALLVVGSILGGIIAAGVDMAAPGLTAGTPLGPESSVAPILWTAIVVGAVFLYQKS